MHWIPESVRQGIQVEIRYSGDDLERLQHLCGAAADRVDFRPQQGDDLGQRLAEASSTAFLEGAAKVAIIGTDCPQLTLEIMCDAFNSLDRADVILGPAMDGGYYLIALRRHSNELFRGLAWGESTVLSDTLSRARSRQMTVHLLPTLADVDRYEDVDLLTHDRVSGGH
jgi:rSAM/selenodomain-associated transferase 1